VHAFVLDEHANTAAFKRIYTCTTTEQVYEIMFLPYVSSLALPHTDISADISLTFKVMNTATLTSH